MVKLVEITSPTCGICRSIAPMIQKAIEPLRNAVDFEVLDGQSERGKNYVEAYNIKAVPCFFFFNSRGDMIYRHQGAISLGEVRARINQILTDN